MKEHKPCIAWETWITLVKNAQEKTGDASHWHRRCLIALMHSACLSRTTDSEREHVEGLSLAFVKLSSSWPLGDASNRCQVSTRVRLRTTDQFCAVLAGGIFCLNMTDLCLRHRATPFPGPERQSNCQSNCFSLRSSNYATILCSRQVRMRRTGLVAKRKDTITLGPFKIIVEDETNTIIYIDMHWYTLYNMHRQNFYHCPTLGTNT